MVIISPSSWPRGVFVVDEQENIINRVPAYERLVTGKKRSYPHEVTILLKTLAAITVISASNMKPTEVNVMATKDNQSKEYRIYIKESKSWVDVNKEFYTNYYRDINAYRKRQQEHGRCVCPASKRYLCDMDCLTCPYAKAGDQLSLDNTISDSDGNEKSWLDDMPDESTAIAEVLEDAELLHALYAKLNELDPEGRLICQLIMQGKSERDCGKEMELSRNTFVYRRDKLFKKLRSELKDYT